MLDPDLAVQESDETNNLSTARALAVGVTAQFDDKPDDQVFGQYVKDVTLKNDFTITLDPFTAQQVTRVTATVEGKVFDFTNNPFGFDHSFDFIFDMAQVNDGDTLQVVTYVGSVAAQTYTYTFKVVTPPTWVDPKKDTISRKVLVFFDPASKQYIFDRQDILGDVSWTTPASSPVFANLPIGIKYGAETSFAFSLAGEATHVQDGPFALINILGITIPFRMPMQFLSLGALQNTKISGKLVDFKKLGVRDLAEQIANARNSKDDIGLKDSITDALKNIQAREEKSFKDKFKKPGGDGLSVSNPQSDWDKSRKNGNSVAQSAFPNIQALTTADATAFEIEKDLTLHAGSFNIGVTLQQEFKAELKQFIGGYGPVAQAYLAASFTETPAITISMDAKADKGNLTVNGKLTAELGIKVKGSLIVDSFFGLAGRAEIGLQGEFKPTLTLTQSTDLTPAKLEVHFPLKIDGIASLSTALELVKVETKINVFSATELGDPTTWKVFGKKALGGHAVFAQPADGNEPNDGLDSPTQLGAVLGSISRTGLTLTDSSDTDVYAFRTIATSTAGDQILLTFASPDAQASARLLDIFGNDIGDLARVDSTHATLDLDGLPAGQYFLSIDGATDQGTAYGLSIVAPDTTRAALATSVSVPTSDRFVTGNPFTVTVTITNYGKAASAAGEARVFWSRDAVFNDEDPTLFVLQVPALAPGESFTKTISTRIPAGILGNIYVAAMADRRLQTAQDSTDDDVDFDTVEITLPPDHFESNNSADAATELGALIGPISQTSLTIDSAEDEDYFRLRLPTAGTADDTITIQRRDNQGDIGFEILDADGNTVYTTLTQPAAVGGSITASFDGLAAGVYTLHVFSNDSSAYFYDMSLTSASRDGINLAPEAITLSSLDLAPGSSQVAHITISNYGTQIARNFPVQLLLEIDGVLTPLGSASVLRLNPGQVLTVDVPFTVPNLPVDQLNRFVGIDVNVDPANAVSELNESDNTLSTTAFLTVAADSHEAEEQSNGFIELGYIKGTQTITGLNLNSFRDRDFFQFRTAATGVTGNTINVNFDPAKGNIRFFVYDADLNTVGESTASGPGVATVDLTGLPAGQYRLLVINTMDLAHPDYTITFNTPSPAGANLIGAAISLDNDQISNHAATVHAKVSNFGDTPAAGFTYQYVLSLDGSFNPATNIVLGTFTSTGLAAGASFTDDRTFDLTGIAAGRYQIGIIADQLAQIAETAETDNIASTSITIFPAPDSAESNNTFDTATPLTLVNQKVTRIGLNLHSTTDIDYFSINVDHLTQAGDTLSLSYDPAGSDLILSIYDSNHELVNQIQSDSGAASLPMDELNTGLYYIVVSPATDLGFSAGYTLGVDLSHGDAPATPAAPGNSTPPITPGPDIDRAPRIETYTPPVSPRIPPTIIPKVMPITTPIPGPVPDPATVPVPNGDFSIDNSADPGFAWTSVGNAGVSQGHLLLTESAGHRSGFSQTLTVPTGATSLRFTLLGGSLNSSALLPGDAFEVALLNASNLPAAGLIQDLSATDALFDLQADGHAFFASSLHSTALGASGDTLSLDSPITFDIDLTGITAGSALTLFFDLLGFGPADSEMLIDNIQWITSGVTPTPPPLSLTLDPSTDSAAKGDNLTNFTTVTLTGKTDPNQVVLLDIDGDGFNDGQTTAGADGSFTFTNVPLTSGLNNIRARATNDGGTTTTPLGVTLDNTPPALTFDLSPATDSGALGDQTTNFPVVDLTGTTEPNLTITLSQSGATTTSAADGSFTFTNIPLNIGQNTLTLTTTDAAGNTTTISHTFTREGIDNTGPVIQVQLSNDNGASNTDKLTSDDHLTGTVADPSGVATLKAGFDTAPAASYVNVGFPAGVVTLSPADLNAIFGGTLSDGPHTLHFIATDTLGNTSTLDFTFTLDTTGPALSASLVNDNGASNSDHLTSDARITGTISDISGISSLTAGFDSTPLAGFGPVTITAGAFDLSVADLNTLFGGPLTDGPHTLHLRGTDSLGNLTTFDLSFTLDTTGPVITVSLATDTGASNSDKLTSDDRITGTIADPSGIATLKAGFDTTPAGSYANVSFPAGVITLTPADLNAIFGGTLNDGPHTLHFIATDALGNSSSFDFTFTLDTTAPALSASLANDNGASNSDHLTSDATITGTVSDLSGITSLTAGFDTTPIANFKPVAISAGAFTLSPADLNALFGGTLTDGAHTLHLIATDNAGNTKTFDLSFTLDTTGPAITAQLVNDTGASNSDKLTSDATITGTATDTNAVASLVGGFDGTTPANFKPITITNGAFTLAPSDLSILFGGPLTDGPHTLHLLATDTLGNTSTLDLTFTLDTTGPTATVSLINDAGVSSTDHLTFDPRLTGQVADPAGIASVVAGFDSTPAANFTPVFLAAGQFTLSRAALDNIFGAALTDGSHTLHFIAADTLGNTSTFDFTFTLDTAAPSLLSPILINSGNSQRSHIDTIDLPFSDDISASLGLDDLQLLLGGTQAVSLAGATLTPAGNHVILNLKGVALPDGEYLLKVLPDGITDPAGNTLDVDNDRASDGGTGKFGSVNFYKLAGDANGDRIVNALDLLLVRKTLNKAPTDPGYDPSGDLDGDNKVDAADSNIAAVNQGHTILNLAPPKLVILESAQTPNDRAVDFGTVTTGASAPIDITLRNDGQKPLTIASIQIVGPDAASFQWEVVVGFVPTSGLTLAAGESRIIRVTMNTFSGGRKSATLRFWHNDASQSAPAAVTLTGTAAPAPGAVSSGEDTSPIISSGAITSPEDLASSTSTTIAPTGSSLSGIGTGVTILPATRSVAKVSTLQGIAPRPTPRPLVKPKPLFNTRKPVGPGAVPFPAATVFAMPAKDIQASKHHFAF